MFIRPIGHTSNQAVTKVSYTDTSAIPILTGCLMDFLQTLPPTRPLVIVCIGTDRSTGDSLGPLVGSRLRTLVGSNSCHVYGTLDFPVHAMNLKETINKIHDYHKNPFIIAIDACLGQLSSVGFVTLSTGPLKPGAGVNKDLPEIGDIHLTGIVNVGGFMEYLVLQNTRLSIVMHMAECISTSLSEAIEIIQSNTYSLPKVSTSHSSAW